MNPIKTWLKANAALLVLLVLGMLAAGVLVLTGLQVLAESRRKADAATVAAAPVKVAEGQAALAGDAVARMDRAATRNELTIKVQQENARALAETPDADLGVTLRRGLCRYAAYASDPGCAEVRVDNSPKLP